MLAPLPYQHHSPIPCSYGPMVISNLVLYLAEVHSCLRWRLYNEEAISTEDKAAMMLQLKGSEYHSNNLSCLLYPGWRKDRVVRDKLVKRGSSIG